MARRLVYLATGALAMVVVAGTSLGIYGLTRLSKSGPHPPAAVGDNPNMVVAWVNRPAPSLTPKPSPLPSYGTAPECGHGALGEPRSGHVGFGLGNTNIQISIRNVSRAACELKGYPIVYGVAANGAVTRLRTPHGSYFGDPGPEGPIGPGKTVAVNFSGGDTCDKHLVYPTFRLLLPSGDRVDVQNHGFDAGCGVDVSRFGVPGLSPPPEQSSLLETRVDAPHSAAIGSTLSYTVTITNGGDVGYELSPCPTYEEYVYVSDGPTAKSTRRDEYLNCDTVTEIPAGGSVTYAMVIDVPAEAGTGKLGWILNVPGRPAAGAAIDVLGAG